MATNQQNGTPPASGKPGDAILNRILGASAGTAGDPAAGQETVVEQTATKDFEVDVGGVKRRVPVDDLVKAYMARTETAASKEALEKRFAEIGDLQSVRALQERISSLDAAKQRRVLELLQGEGADDQEPEETGDEIDRTLGGAPRSREDAPLSRVLQQRFDQMERAVQALAARENGRLQTEHKQTTGERVDALMRQYPIFKDEKSAAAREFAKDSIMTQLLTRQGVDPEVVVQEAASKLQAFAQKAQDEVREEVGVPRRLEGLPKGGPKGAHLRSGALRKIAQNLIGGQRR